MDIRFEADEEAVHHSVATLRGSNGAYSEEAVALAIFIHNVVRDTKLTRGECCWVAATLAGTAAHASGLMVQTDAPELQRDIGVNPFDYALAVITVEARNILKHAIETFESNPNGKKGH